MEKRIALLLVLTLLLGLISGCGAVDSTAAVSSVSVPQDASIAHTNEDAAPAEASEVSTTEGVVPEEAPTETAITQYGLTFQTENGNPTEAQKYDISLPVTDSDEVFSLYMIMSPAVIGNINQFSEENIAWKTFCETTGLNLDIHLVHPGNKQTEVSLMLASCEYYDIMQDVLSTYTGGADQAIEDEFVVDLTTVLPEAAPNYWSMITYSKESYETISSETGKITGFARISNSLQPENGNVIRQDYLDDLNLEVPSTVNELHDVLTAFKNEKGTDSAMWLPGRSAYETMDILSAFYGSSEFYVKDDVVSFGPIEDAFREYITLLAQWYSEGLIYRDFYENTDDLRVEDISLVASQNIAVASTEVNKIAAFNSTIEGSRWVAMAPVTQNAEDVLHTGGTKAYYMEMIDLAITTACSDPETVCAAFDYLYTDEGSLLANYGVEGLTYALDDNGDPQYTEMMTADPDSDIKTMILLNCFDIGPYVEDVYRTASTLSEDQLNAYTVWYSPETNDQAWNLPDQVTLTTEEHTEYSNYYAEYDSYFLEMVSQFITGAKSIDDEWDTYVDTMNQLGVQASIALYQTAYDRYIGK